VTDTRTATARRSAASARGSSESSGRPDRAAAGSWPVRERSLLGPVLGVPPLVAVGLAVGLTAIGVVVDLLRVGTVATIFQVAYGAGCLLAVAWVRRRSIFLPAIQPPLLLAVVVPVLAVLVGAPSSTAGVTEHLLLAGAPLINAFPAMAVTTVLVLLVAGFRLVRQRTGPDDAVGSLRARLSGRRSGGDGGPDRAPARTRPARRTPGAGAAGKGAAGRTAAATTGSGRGRTSSSRARTDTGGEPRGGTAKDGPRSGGARASGPRECARSDDAAPDATRRSARGGRPVRGTGSGSGSGTGSGSGRGSGDGTRSRRPRPTDPG
jgi:hypothetical protein